MHSISKDASSFEGLVADTTKELATAILDYTSYLLDLFNTTDDFAFAHLRELDSIGTERIQVLVEACSEPSCAQKVQKLQSQLRDIQTMVQSNSYQIIPSFDVKTQGSYIKLLIADIRHICKECLKLVESFPNLSSHSIDDFKKETPKLGMAPLSASHYRGLEPDQIDQKATWFRHHFVGKPYLTLIGSFDQEKTAPTEHTEGGLAKKKRQSLTRSRNSKTLMSAFLNSSHDLSGLSTSNQTVEQSYSHLSSAWIAISYYCTKQ
ncbi:hypothetical protein EDC96DRAFT_259690 [Choanephora cucurbitarum]|nr:hypothetical protein EDC96DRAFT_259690 [Choanephora cucurbitarum]